jgi:predicted cobalt transporter CbtA
MYPAQRVGTYRLNVQGSATVKILIVLVVIAGIVFALLQVIPIALLYRENHRLETVIAMRARTALPLPVIDTRAFITDGIVKLLDDMGAQYHKEDIQVDLDEKQKRVSVQVRYWRSHRAFFVQNPKPLYARVKASSTAGEETGGYISTEKPVGPLFFVAIGFGFLLVFVSNVWMIVEGFRVSVVWGLLNIFVPFASLAFLVIYWERARTPFIVGSVGVSIFGGSIMLLIL